MKGFTFVALLLLTLIQASSVDGPTVHAAATVDDWPTYLHDAERTAASGDTVLSSLNAGQLRLLWSMKTGGAVAASPTVVGGTVYVGSWDGYEYAIDAASGTVKWKTFLGTTNAPGCFPAAAGVSSAATVQGGVVYLGGGDSNWYALDAATGAVLWSVFSGDNGPSSGHYNWSSPLIFNGYAYVGVASMGDCPLVQGQLLQVSLTTHQVVNTFNAVPTGQVGGGIWTSPSLDAATNTVYVSTGTENDVGQLYAQAVIALDASTLARKASWKLPEAVAVVDSDFGNSPILFNDASGTHLVAVTNKNGYVYAFDRRNIAAGPVWQQRVAIGGTCATCGQGSVSSGAFANGVLFMAGGNAVIAGAGHQGSVQALNPSSGAILWQHGAPGPVIPALAYSNGLLIDGAGPYLEVLDAITGSRLYSFKTDSTLYAAPSVSNGAIFTGSAGGTIYAFAATVPAPPPPDPACPAGWSCQDIGSVAPAGSESASAGAISISAGGPGIGGTADAFRFVAQTLSGDGAVVAEVMTIQPPGGGGQAGIMVRQSVDPGAASYGLLVAPGGSVQVQYRAARAGPTVVLATTPSGALPVYLEIQRQGDTVRAATSSDGTNYTLVAGTDATVVMPTSILAGLAVSSGIANSAGTSNFASASVGPSGPSPTAPAPSTACPSGWTCEGVGNPLFVGSQTLSSGTWMVQGAGADIAGYADQFHLIWQSVPGDGTVSARVVSQTNTHASAKAGLMMRQSSAFDAAYYGAFVTPTNGIWVEYRLTSGLNTTKLVTTPRGAPAYLLLARSGGVFSTYTSTDGVSWTYVVGTSVAISGLDGTLRGGMAVTSHNASALGTAAFDTVSLGTTAPPPPTICPTGWSCGDVGTPAVAGGQSEGNGTWALQGAGGDIWSSADQFHFVWQTLATDGVISARVTSQVNTNAWAKAGVMMRASTDRGAPYYAVMVTPSHGIVIQYRTTQGAITQQAATPGGVPAFMQVARVGQSFAGYTSNDGITWTYIPGTGVSIDMGATVLAGMAITSHDPGHLGTAVFDTVGFGTSAPPPPTACPNAWSCADIGQPILSGAQSITNGAWTLQGAGGDIWGTSDQFHFVWQNLSGDVGLSARVANQSNTDLWAKSGVMVRGTTNPSSAYYAALVTPGHGIAVQYRATVGAPSQQVLVPGATPTYLRVVRSGGTFTAYTSSDSVNWVYVPGTSVALSGLSGTMLTGLAITSHNVSAVGTATFDTVAASGSVLPPPGTPTPANTAPPTSTNSPTATNTPLSTSTNTAQPTSTNTALPTSTNTAVPTFTDTATATNTALGTSTITPLPTSTNTALPTATNTAVPTLTYTATATNTALITSTNTPLPTSTNTALPTATNTAVPTLTDTATATNTPTPTNTPPTSTSTPPATPTIDPTLDSDGDGCPDARELGPDWHTGEQRDPNNPWDFADVPAPAAADPAPNGPRDRVISLKDVLSTLFYVGTHVGDVGHPNANGVTYDSTKDGDWFNATTGMMGQDGVVGPDDAVGRRFDRTASADPSKPWQAGPPNGVVSLADVLVVMNSVGTNCN